MPTPRPISIRLAPDLLARLQARAITRGVTRSEAIREAITAYLASEPEIRGPLPDIHLPDVVARTFDIPRSQARADILLGRIEVNGRVVTSMDLPPGPPGQVLQIKRRPN